MAVIASIYDLSAISLIFIFGLAIPLGWGGGDSSLRQNDLTTVIRGTIRSNPLIIIDKKI
jgi:hypothetical protein